jgi:hypothetical protein
MNVPHAGVSFYDGTQGPTGSTFSGSHSALTELAYPSSGHTGIVPLANLPWNNQQRNFLPTDLGAGLIEWWRGDLGIGLTGAEITTWTGQKNGYIWAKLAGVDAPIVGSGINSLPTVKFNGTSQVLVNNSLGGVFAGASRPYMVFMVFKRLNSAGQYIWMQGDGTYYHIVSGYNGNGYIFHQRYVHTNYNNTVGITQAGTTNPTLVTFYTDRMQTGTTPLPTITGRESGKTIIDRLDWTHGGNTRNMQYGILGAFAHGPTYASRSSYANVEIAEIILLNIPETDLVVDLVEQYLIERYAIKAYEGTPYAIGTPVGTVREVGSGLTFAALDTDHHFVLKPTAAASAVNLPALNNTTKFREYIFTRDVQAVPTSAFPANIVANGTDTIKAPNGSSFSTYAMYGKQESIRLKGATNFSVSPFFYWQVVGSPPENEYSIGLMINGLTEKTTPVDADMFGLMDSAASNLLKKLSWTNTKATLKSYNDTLYAAISPKVKFTVDGGLAVKLTNKSGSTSTKGYCVKTSSTTSNAVTLSLVDIPDCIGVFYESDVADGQEAWVVVSGIADVYYGTSTTMGHVARTLEGTDAYSNPGYAISQALFTPPFAVDKHFMEIGHLLETRSGAGLAKTVLHFN